MNKLLFKSVLVASLFSMSACNNNPQGSTDKPTKVDSASVAPENGTNKACAEAKPDIKTIGVALYCKGDTAELNSLLEENSELNCKGRYFYLKSEGDFEQKNICYYWVRNDKKILVASFSRFIGIQAKPDGTEYIAHNSDLGFYLYDPNTNKLESIANPIAPALDKPGKDQRIDAYFSENSDSDDFTVAYCSVQQRSLEDAAKTVTLKWNGMGFDRK